MELEEFLALVRRSQQQRTFFHFTDSRNLPSIRQHGLLSTHRLRSAGIEVPALGGNQWSLDADRASGMDRYVHLCFMMGHPMVHHAIDDGRILEVRYLRIKPEVILLPGVMISDDVSNQSGVVPGPAAETIDDLDTEVVYTRTDWNDAAIQERLQAAHRKEILIPDHVPLDLIDDL